MRASIFIIILALVSLTSAIAQGVRGRVLGEQAKPLEGATIILQTSDSTYLSGAIASADGSFSFANHLPRFRLLIQHIGYQTYSSEHHSPLVGDIHLEPIENTLKELSVVGRKPLVKLEQGKFVYDAPELLKGRIANSAFDLIKRLPSVLETNGSLSLIGTNELTIVLNGRPSTMSTGQLRALLSSMPASRVASLEVMYSPEPKYQTRGAVINVVLRRGEEAHWRGEVQTRYTEQYASSFSGQVNLLYDSPTFTLDALYAPSLSRSVSPIGLEGWHYFQGKRHDLNQEQTISTTSQGHLLRLGADYTPSQAHQFAASYTTDMAPHRASQARSVGSFEQDFNDKTASSYMHNLSANYRWSRGLEIGVDYLHYRYTSDQKMSIATQSVHSQFEIDASQYAHQAKVYLNGHFNSIAKLRVTYGGIALLNQTRDQQTAHRLKGNPIALPDLKGLTQEQIYELYAGLSYKIGNTWLSGSLTGEYYHRGSTGRWHIYPNLSLNYMKTPAHIVQFSLSSDKDYPPYKQMQHSISYLDVYSQVHGNPLLTPMRTHRASLNYLYKQDYAVQLFWTYQPNYFQQSAYQSTEELALIYKTLNWDYALRMGANLVAPVKLGSVLDSRITLGMMQTRLKTSNFHGHQLDRQKLNAYLYLDNSIMLLRKPKLSLDVSSYFVSPSIQTNYDLTSLWLVNAGLQCSLMDDRLTLNLKGNDLFETGAPLPTAELDGNRLLMHVDRNLRSVVLSLSYRFGGYKKRKHNQVDTSRFGG
ncbi:MAG: outer membrane beta-barrel family protein [Porphyromonadaceae bacterium]|nr:outer membrane beta-barrel family protein [Porphyromonadaceae bacterium]